MYESLNSLIQVIFTSGRGGASIYGKEFDDEIHGDLKHTGNLFLPDGRIFTQILVLHFFMLWEYIFNSLYF